MAFLGAIFLLIAHSFNVDYLRVDSTSIILLVIALSSPFIASVKKIKYGDFEAEIDSKEIEKIKAEIESNPDLKNDDKYIGSTIDATTESIRDLAKSDPIIALAKIRIELEKTLKKLIEMAAIENDRATLGNTVKALARHEMISSQTANSLLRVISICNRAIHGEAISDADTSTIVELGIRLLDEVSWDLEVQLASGLVKSETIISHEELHAHYEKKYRLTSIIPLVNEPKKIIRELNQEQLEDYLDGYGEFAEFIVELVEIN